MILAELFRVQERQGYVSADEARAVAERLGVPLHRVEGVLSFYPHFRRTPPEKIEIAVCRDLTCMLAGRPSGVGHEVSCLGLCDEAPAAAVNDVPVGHVTAEMLRGMAAGTIPIPPPAPAGPAGPRPAWILAGPHPEAPAELDAAAVISALKEAGLRGLGGAGFPTGQKWELVRAAAGTRKFAICNADESEPGTFKDRALLEHLPELVLEGLWLAARVVGAERAIVYLRHEYGRALRALRGVLSGASPPVPTEIFVSPGGYIMGEETALLEALEDRRGEPRNKPPFPGTHGLHGCPTVINNVETLCAAAVIARRGAAWWREQGVRGAAGLKLMAVSGHVARPGVYEVPMGTTVAELLARAGGVVGGALLAFAPGGASSNFLPADKVDTPLDFQALAQAGSMLGSGALVVVAEGTDLLAVSANVASFFRNESCGKCVPCRVGSEKAVALLEDVRAGRRSEAELDALEALEETMRLTSICGLGQVALGPSLSLRRNFRGR